MHSAELIESLRSRVARLERENANLLRQDHELWDLLTDHLPTLGMCEDDGRGLDHAGAVRGLRAALAQLAELKIKLPAWEPGLRLPDGTEAEELRSGIEAIVGAADFCRVSVDQLQSLLSRVDARDSLQRVGREAASAELREVLIAGLDGQLKFEPENPSPVAAYPSASVALHARPVLGPECFGGSDEESHYMSSSQGLGDES